MTTPIAQRTITITVNATNATSAASATGANAGAAGQRQEDGQINVPPPSATANDVTYSYWSPITGMSYTNAQLCEMKIDRPTSCLFVLDYQSTLAGWTITKTEPYGESPALAFLNGPNNQSIQTFNPYKNVGDTYRYYIFYRNILTGDVFKEDPQEGNVVR